ncbi:MAG: ankyrin repeat domain-containing protein [Candidatus Dependentiae bacterium]|nr:ankyrin repeat domain-containing protein [Candidatus Dependentiae bacterium]
MPKLLSSSLFMATIFFNTGFCSLKLPSKIKPLKLPGTSVKKLQKQAREAEEKCLQRALGMIRTWNMTEFPSTLELLEPLSADAAMTVQLAFIARLAFSALEGNLENVKAVLNYPTFEPKELINEEVTLTHKKLNVEDRNLTLIHAILISKQPNILTLLKTILSSPKVAGYLKLTRIVSVPKSVLYKKKSGDPRLLNKLLRTGKLGSMSPLHLLAKHYCNAQGALIADQLLSLNEKNDPGSTIVNAKNLSGNTAAHLAASGGCKELLSVLKKHGADFSIKNGRGQTVDAIAQARTFAEKPSTKLK